VGPAQVYGHALGIRSYSSCAWRDIGFSRGNSNRQFLTQSFGKAKILDDAFAKANESLGCEGQPLSASKKKPPAPLQLAFAKRQCAKGAFRQFLSSYPGREDADPETEFNEFFNRFHIAELNGCGQHHLFVGKIILDHLVQIAGFCVEDEFLAHDLTSLKAPGVRPWVARADHELKLVFE